MTKRDQLSVFIPFEELPEIQSSAENLSFSLKTAQDASIDDLHPLARLAAQKLQHYLADQQDWEHNFGLQDGAEGMVVGKMFGVLVVRNKTGQLGYLSAFSGKLAGKNNHVKFVPPLFDGLKPGGFLNAGMEQLSHMSDEIRALQLAENENSIEIKRLKSVRRAYSAALQDRIFEQYHFLNKTGELKALTEIFKLTAAKKPSAGAGECAAPKLLQYAFLNELQPLALAEFWWGLSPKSAHWKHGQFYLPCKEKCEPILAHMLS